jgi:hypothetical protein
MLKYVSKFVLDILPSVVATIIGAYIVNHYIATKPTTDTPVAAAVSTVDPKPVDPKTIDAKKSDPKAAKSEAKASEAPSDAAGAPEPGVVKKAAEKSADKPAETANVPTETRRHQPTPRDKTVAKTAPAAVPTPAPPVAAASIVPPVETSPTQEERRDANDMARAAIERLRSSSEASRAPDVPRAADAPRAAPVQPLPPAIMVSTPSGDSFNPNGTPKPPYTPVARVDDPRRPTPPADIPTTSRPIDLHAEATASTPERTTVAEEVLSAAKSVFHAVLPR